MKQLFHILLVLAICAWILFSSADSPRSNSEYAYDYIEELFLQDQPEIRKFAAAIVFGLEKPNLTETRYLIADSLGSWSLSNDNGKSYGKSMTPKRSKNGAAYAAQYNAFDWSWWKTNVHAHGETESYFLASKK